MNITSHQSGWTTLLLQGMGLALAASGALAEEAVHQGPVVTLHDGSARTYLVIEDDKPVEVGVALDSAFLAALPKDGASGGEVMPNGHSTFAYMLNMPAINPTPFQYVMLDWNPAGHEPHGVYDQPHFDVHFYIISDAQRHAISPDDLEFMAKAHRLPPSEFIPAGYIEPGLAPVPLMGMHLVDPASPELRPENPERFTRTFIYGSWDGQLIFAEPMITTAYLEQRGDVTVPVPVAERYNPQGYYPGAYNVRWDEAAGEYRISLTDLRWR